MHIVAERSALAFDLGNVLADPRRRCDIAERRMPERSWDGCVSVEKKKKKFARTELIYRGAKKPLG